MAAEATFHYRAVSSDGKSRSGVITAADSRTAARELRRQGLTPLHVGAEEKKGLSFEMPSFGGSRRKDILFFTQELSTLINSGVPLDRALTITGELTVNPKFRSISGEILRAIKGGKSLADSLKAHPTYFSDLYVNMVRAGEQSGALEEVLRRQAAHFERFAEVQAKFKSAMIYPLVVSFVGVALVIFFMTAMLPKFMTLFESIQGLELPATTQFLISSSRFLTRWWWLFPIVGALFMILFRRYHASTEGRRTIDRFKLKVPIFGSVVRLNLFGQFARTLGTLLRNGVPVLQALRITEQIVPNVVVAEAIAKTREGVTDGKTLAQPLAKSGLFPQLMIDLLKIGEETGDIPGALENVAETYERELTLGLRAMTNLIEPLMIVGIAIIVGFLLLSVMSAMFAITQSIQR